MSSGPPVVPPPSPGTPSDRDICQYIAEMCAELRGLASGATFRTLNYLLDMARLEAERLARSLPE